MIPLGGLVLVLGVLFLVLLGIGILVFKMDSLIWRDGRAAEKNYLNRLNNFKQKVLKEK